MRGGSCLVAANRCQGLEWRDAQRACVRHKAVLVQELVPTDPRAKLRSRTERQCGSAAGPED